MNLNRAELIDSSHNLFLRFVIISLAVENNLSDETDVAQILKKSLAILRKDMRVLRPPF